MVVKGLGPVLELAPAETLMTGRSTADVGSDPRRGSVIGTLGDGEPFVMPLTDAFTLLLPQSISPAF